MITVRVLLFASAREAANGLAELSCEIGDESDETPVDTALLRKVLAQKFPRLADLVLDEACIMLAVNEEYVQSTVVLKSGDTVALIPPISGG